MQYLASILLFIALAGGAALKAKDYTDTFDDPPGLTSVPLLSQVGANEKGALDYNAYGYVDLSLTAGLLLKPNSGKYVAGSGVTNAVRGGTRGFQLKKGFKSFTPRTIYTVCMLYSGTGRTPVPTKCTLRFTGQKANAPQGTLVQQDFNYDPALQPNQFAKQTFRPDFKDVTNVNVTFVPETDALLLVQDLDTFTYTGYS